MIYAAAVDRRIKVVVTQVPVVNHRSAKVSAVRMVANPHCPNAMGIGLAAQHKKRQRDLILENAGAKLPVKKRLCLPKTLSGMTSEWAFSIETVDGPVSDSTATCSFLIRGGRAA